MKKILIMALLVMALAVAIIYTPVKAEEIQKDKQITITQTDMRVIVAAKTYVDGVKAGYRYESSYEVLADFDIPADAYTVALMDYAINYFKSEGGINSENPGY